MAGAEKRFAGQAAFAAKLINFSIRLLENSPHMPLRLAKSAAGADRLTLLAWLAGHGGHLFRDLFRRLFCHFASAPAMAGGKATITVKPDSSLGSIV